MFHIYNLATGLFTGAGFNVHPPTDAAIAANTPAGCGVRELERDQVGKVRVDVASGALVPHAPPQPSAEVQQRIEVLAARDRRMAEIRALEAGQHRALRSLAIDPTDETARQVLVDLEAQIDVLRGELRSIETTTGGGT